MGIDKQQIIDQVIKFITQFFAQNDTKSITEPDVPKQDTITAIDWTNASCKVTEHFIVGDALMLHSWDRLANEADGADFNKLTILCKKMEEIRSLLNCVINVHCMFRSQAYNASQNIKPQADVHSMNLACDFDANSHLTIDQAKAILRPKLEELNIRMEYGTASWIHIDLHAVGPSGREFHV